MISVCFQGKPLQIYAPITNAEEDEVEQFYKDLQDFLELTAKKKKKKCSFHHRGPECKSKKSRVTGKFGLGVQNETGQRLTEFCQENTPIIANTLI